MATSSIGKMVVLNDTTAQKIADVCKSPEKPLQLQYDIPIITDLKRISLLK